MKWLILLALPLMSACDSDSVPEEPATPAPPKVVVAPSAASPTMQDSTEAPTVLQREQDAPKEIEIEVEQVEGGNPDQLPSDRVVPPPKPKPATAAVSKKKVEKVELPPPELDLSLPEDWSETLEPADEPTSMNLLPPLFESDKGSRSLQMSGELLPGAAQDEAIIDGAQINFEIKR